MPHVAIAESDAPSVDSALFSILKGTFESEDKFGVWKDCWSSRIGAKLGFSEFTSRLPDREDGLIRAIWVSFKTPELPRAVAGGIQAERKGHAERRCFADTACCLLDAVGEFVWRRHC